MDSFHIASDAAFWSCGDDQTTVWSETTGSVQPAPEFGFDLGLDSQFTVSTVSSRVGEITHVHRQGYNLEFYSVVRKSSE